MYFDDFVAGATWRKMVQDRWRDVEVSPDVS